MRTNVWLAMSCLLAWPLYAGPAEDAASSARQPSSPVAAEPDDSLAAEALIREHLPEVRRIVDILKASAPEEYQKAIQDLARSYRRLQSIKKRDPELFTLEVALLKAQVRIDTLASQLQLADGQATHDALKQALQERAQLRLARTERQRTLTAERVQSLTQDLQQLEQEVERRRAALASQTQRDYEQLVRRSAQIRQRQLPRKPQ
jgi:DNA repair exonuclease SbcCD ATPase subunit